MGRIIKVRCNGQKKDVNDVGLNDILRETSVARDPNAISEFPARVVLRCRHCADGKVIITREMMEESFGKRTK